jgi:hypothetical protein
MNKSIFIFLIFISSTIFSTSCGKKYECPQGDSEIVGARCNDGTTTDATGQGACSHHDGVESWLCCCE